MQRLANATLLGHKQRGWEKRQAAFAKKRFGEIQ
jgi:hypothetical protein